MAEAILMLSDKDGSIALEVLYEGGFDKASHAHQHMLLLTKSMNTIARKIEEPKLEFPVIEVVGG